MMNKRKLAAICLSAVLGLGAVAAVPLLPVTAQAEEGRNARDERCQVIGSAGYMGLSDNLSAVHDGTYYLTEPYAGVGDGNPYVVTNYKAAQYGDRDLKIEFMIRHLLFAEAA